MTKWQTKSRPGYFGRQRDELYRKYDIDYGEGNWRIAWRIGEYIGALDAVTAVYEDAYMAFLSCNGHILEQLVDEAGDVYDDAPSNVDSGLNYAIQETGRTHLQDIAIRRCLVRRGLWFMGSGLIQVRDTLGDHPLSMMLSPGRVPFHMPNLILQPSLVGWWEENSVEQFYQSNKLLQYRLG